MNRLRTLKKRIARSDRCVGIMKLNEGWFIGWGTCFSDSDCAGPFSRREAIFKASRIAMPYKAIEVTLTAI